jgi:thioredoxin reductase (NADPH)
MERIKCLIIGSGPAGYTAAIYAARAELKPILYTGLQMGGQLTLTTEVDNFPGYPNGVDGNQMMSDLKKQAERFGTDIRFGIVTNIEFNNNTTEPHIVTIDDSIKILTDTIIISTGATAKWLGLDSEKRLNGFGVSACAVCDGFFFKDQDVIVVGGGDTACEEASYLSKLCNSITMLVRGSEMKASQAMQKRVNTISNINIIYNVEVNEILGDKTVTGVKTYSKTINEHEVINATGVFIAIGHTPNTQIFKDKLDMDDHGYLITKDKTTKTNIDGVFACGDVQDNIYRQAVTAAGTGCMAALDAERYLSQNFL